MSSPRCFALLLVALAAGNALGDLCDNLNNPAEAQFWSADCTPDSATTGVPADTDAYCKTTFALEKDGMMRLSTEWSGSDLPPPETENHTIVGMHVHKGDMYTNGPIMAACCSGGGSSTLLQLNDVDGNQIPGCPQTPEYLSCFFYDGQDPPSVPGISSNRVSSVSEITKALGEAAYFNIHTVESVALVAGNGLTRGQLSPMANPCDYMNGYTDGNDGDDGGNDAVGGGGDDGDDGDGNDNDKGGNDGDDGGNDAVVGGGDDGDDGEGNDNDKGGDDGDDGGNDAVAGGGDDGDDGGDDKDHGGDDGDDGGMDDVEGSGDDGDDGGNDDHGGHGGGHGSHAERGSAANPMP